MHEPFPLLREVLAILVMAEPEQRAALQRSRGPHEVVGEFFYGLAYVRLTGCPLTGATLDDDLISDLHDLDASLAAASDDPSARGDALYTHPAWVAARRTARELLARLPDRGPEGFQPRTYRSMRGRQSR